MGLSNVPAPADGFLCILLVNTALTTISVFRRIFRSIHPIPSSSSHYDSSSTSSSSFQVFHPTNNTTTPYYSSSASSDQYTFFIEEFHRTVPAIRFDSITTINCNGTQQDCTVCLTRFEPDSVVNRLCHCGHIFHKLCLERWLDYWNITCPLCRTPLLLMSSSSSSSQQPVLPQHDHHDHDHVHEELEQDQEEGEASILAFGDQIF